MRSNSVIHHENVSHNSADLTTLMTMAAFGHDPGASALGKKRRQKAGLVQAEREMAEG